MNKKTILIAIMSMAVTFGNAALADNDKGRGDRGDRGRHEQAQRHDHGHHDRHARHDNRRYSYEADRRGPGAGRNHDLYRGQRLSSDYRHSYYVVNDWRDHRLSAPPRGHHWVQTGPDYVLVAITSGIIASIILSH